MSSVGSGVNIFGGLFQRRIIETEAALLAGIRHELGNVADDMENWARENAVWEDRTGDARDGLFAELQAERGDEFVIVLYGVAPENLWLEIAMSQQYSIIRPTLEKFGPEVMKAVGGIF